MSNQTIKLLKMIEQNKTCNEICQELNISNKQLYNNITNLKNKGFILNRKYYSTGDIVYTFTNSHNKIKEYKNNYNTSIITNPTETSLKTLVISDLHIGNSLARIDLLDKVYEYCINNNIHIIFCCGDFIDGNFNYYTQSITSIYDQIETFIKKYPFDKNILTFGVGGNHDYASIKIGHQDIIEILKNYRHDIIISNYKEVDINIKNDFVHLFHSMPWQTTYEPSSTKNNPFIVLCGHSHKFSILSKDKQYLKIDVPTLSDLKIKPTLPAALEMTLNFEQGYIENIYLKQICFLEEILTLSEISLNLPNDRKNDKIINEEKKNNVKILTK